MKKKLSVCSITLLIGSVLTLSFGSMKDHLQSSDSQQEKNLSLNIYDQPLEQCGTSQMNPGSWDAEYKCSQKYGGVHQICIERIAHTTNKFSLNTGQTDWSTGRGDDNHCVCLGAWSLYNARKNKNQISDGGQKQLKCSAIPRIALTKGYVKNFSKNPFAYQGWQRWNNLELENQVVDGVNQLFNQCKKNITQYQLSALKKNYCQFAKGISQIQSSETYIANCSSSFNL